MNENKSDSELRDFAKEFERVAKNYGAEGFYIGYKDYLLGLISDQRQKDRERLEEIVRALKMPKDFKGNLAIGFMTARADLEQAIKSNFK